jgi:hypothetical protein
MSADQDLLFGLLALQNGFLDQAQLIAAFQAWTLDKNRPLADHLLDRGDLATLGPRSDVYSLGATLYTLLVGKPPFEGTELLPLLRYVQTGRFPPPRQLDPSIDPPLDAIVRKAMALDQAARYPSARDLADDVERWLADEPVNAYPEPWTRTLNRWLTRHRTAVTGAAAALLVGLIGLGTVASVQIQGRAALAAKNAELEAANTRVKARYDLAVDAVKTFHTGVSQDFLLQEPQFKDLRDRLINSAANFYQRLGRLLERDADRESRPGRSGSSRPRPTRPAPRADRLADRPENSASSWARRAGRLRRSRHSSRPWRSSSSCEIHRPRERTPRPVRHVHPQHSVALTRHAPHPRRTRPHPLPQRLPEPDPRPRLP